MTSVQIALIVLLLPLASAAVIALFLRKAGNAAATVSVLSCAALAAASLVLSYGGQRFEASAEWLRLGDFTLSLGIRFDDLAALMLTIVAVVGLCVHVFSLGYMKDDAARPRYFGGLSVFMFSMIGIVLADNLFMMFIFWELVGFSSWLLINHYLEKQSAADAAKKAFIVNRVGDFGFLLGLVWCQAAYGTTNLGDLGTLAAEGAVVSAGIPLLLFCGAVGKSAQMPLHVWLPDAMEGPTPVSALIHAATMVAAGIFMLCRIHVLMVPDALHVIAWVGTATALYAALCAITQSDIKKVLAYSTLSQLGYMVAAFGLGSVAFPEAGEVAVATGIGAAMFHLATHAFFKALLFLGSGSVIHGCHHEQDIFRMGGLRRAMPFTFATFTVGVLAIIGMPYVAAGFFSKDAILHLALEHNRAIFAVLAFTAVLTAFYMVRLWILVFLGTPRSEAASHAHEGGFTMTAPLGLLAVLSVIGGYTAIWGGAFDGVWELVPHAEGATIIVASVGVMILGSAAAFALYRPAAEDALSRAMPPVFGTLSLLRSSFDAGYDYYVAKVQQRFALLVNFLEQIALAGLIVRGLAGVVGLIGIGARALHVGNLHAYVYWFLIGTALLWAWAAGIF
jgi:NADH-quinone oxidoreductase subunit L